MENYKLKKTKYKQMTSDKRQVSRKFYCCLFFVFCILLFAPSGASACSCIRGTPEQYFNDADVVFTGKVLEVEHNVENVFEVKFEIVERQKMSGSDRTVIIRTALTAAECGYDFQPGVTYVVYAIEDGSRLYTDLCSGNHKHYGK